MGKIIAGPERKTPWTVTVNLWEKLLETREKNTVGCNSEFIIFSFNKSAKKSSFIDKIVFSSSSICHFQFVRGHPSVFPPFYEQ